MFSEGGVHRKRLVSGITSSYCGVAWEKNNIFASRSGQVRLCEYPYCILNKNLIISNLDFSLFIPNNIIDIK